MRPASSRSASGPPRKAHEALLSWRMGEVDPDPADRVHVDFPMPTSPVEDIAKVMQRG